MKFSKYLAKGAVAEWETNYLEYRRIKHVINKMKEENKDIKKNKVGVKKISKRKDQNVQMEFEEILKKDIEEQHNQIDNVLIFDGYQVEADSMLEVEMFDFLQKEVLKIETFYKEKSIKLRTNFENIIKFQRLCEARNIQEHNNGNSTQKFKTPNADLYEEFLHYLKKVKKSILELYRFIQLVKNYQILNTTGLVKILKKINKKLGLQWTHQYLNYIQNANIFNDKSVKVLEQEVEDYFRNHFTKSKSNKEMHNKLNVDIQLLNTINKTTRSFFILGMNIGLSILLCIFMVIQAFNNNQHSFELLPLFSGFFITILLCFCMAMNCFIWDYKRINYKFIFELDPRNHLLSFQFAELVSVFLLLFSIFGYFCFTPINIIPVLDKRYYPIVYLILCFVILILPFNVFYFNARKWLLEVIYKIVLSPFYRVDFKLFFIADQINSLSYSFSSFQILLCYTINHFEIQNKQCNLGLFYWGLPFLCLPPLWRLLQCFRRFYDSNYSDVHPHLSNALKYILNLSALIMSFVYKNNPNSTFTLVFWLVMTIVANVYAFFWDVIMDWGLLIINFKSFKNFLSIRNRFQYPKKVYVYFVISNLILRTSWIIPLIVSSFNLKGYKYSDISLIWLHPNTIAFTLAFFEIIRRFQWNLIRMENEHLNNCGQFRATKEIPLPTLLIENDDNEKLV